MLIRFAIPRSVCHRDRNAWRKDAEAHGIRFEREPKPVAIFDYAYEQYIILQEVADSGGEVGAFLLVELPIAVYFVMQCFK